MAIFLLINSVGYTIYAHYCDDVLKTTSLIVKSESCCDEDASADIPVSSSGMSCCAEKGIHIVLKDQFLKSELSFNAISQPVLFLNTISYSQFFLNQVEFNQPLLAFVAEDKSPPPDLNILHSVFRI